MYNVTMPKKESMTITVKTPKMRGVMPPKGQTHKDKRRKAKVHQRASFRKELA
jgi:hypothetical protein